MTLKLEPSPIAEELGRLFFPQFFSCKQLAAIWAH